MKELRPAFDQLARLLDLWSRKSSGQAFVALLPEGQDSVLEQLAHGQIPIRGFPQEAMFRALHTLVLEGFLSDPVHGGKPPCVRVVSWVEARRQNPQLIGHPAFVRLMLQEEGVPLA